MIKTISLIFRHSVGKPAFKEIGTSSLPVDKNDLKKQTETLITISTKSSINGWKNSVQLFMFIRNGKWR